MQQVMNNRILMTAGDTFRAQVEIRYPDGQAYVPEEGDRLRFAMKLDSTSDDVLIKKEIPIYTMALQLDPDQTKGLVPGKTYLYDIELTHANGDIDTVISNGKMKVLPEVC